MSEPHVVGCTSLLFSHFWNIDREHDMGSPLSVVEIRSIVSPVGSKSICVQIYFQFGATDLIISTFFPSGVRMD